MDAAWSSRTQMLKETGDPKLSVPKLMYWLMPLNSKDPYAFPATVFVLSVRVLAPEGGRLDAEHVVHGGVHVPPHE